jgi:putative transcriptional regulator
MTDHPDDEAAAISVRLDALLGERQMTLTELSDRVGVTVVNLSVLKNGRARAIRFSTLAALCRVLDCQPGDLIRYDAGQPAPAQPAPAQPAPAQPAPIQSAETR